jgi:hypothetical protein
MADRAGFRVEGLSRVVRGLKTLGLEVEDLKGAFAAIAAEAAAVEARYVPRRSGRLASTVRGNRAQSKAVVTAGRATVPYAGPINYGWPAHGIAPAGFQQKTDEEMRPRAIRMLEDEINRSAQRKGLT